MKCILALLIGVLVLSSSHSVHASADFNIGATLGASLTTVKHTMHGQKIITNVINDSDDDFPGDRRLVYDWHGHGDTMITIVFDKRTHRCVYCQFAVVGSDNGLHASLDDWSSIMRRFGLATSEAPDDIHPAYVRWTHFRGGYLVHIYGHLPERTTWAIEACKLGENYSGLE